MSEERLRDITGLPAGMQYKYFSLWHRAFRTSAVIVPLLITAWLLISNHPGEGAWRFAGIFTAMCALGGGYVMWRKRSTVVPYFDVYVIPRAEKLDKFYISLRWAFWALVGITTLVCFGSSNKVPDSIIFISLLLLFEVCYFISVFSRSHREVPPGKADVIGPKLGTPSVRPKIPLLDGFPWYFRYLTAVFLIYLSCTLPTQQDNGVPSLVLMVIGVCSMYEILGGIILCAVVYWVFGALAAVPTSVAVLVGAYWIAESNKKK